MKKLLIVIMALGFAGCSSYKVLEGGGYKVHNYKFTSGVGTQATTNVVEKDDAPGEPVAVQTVGSKGYTQDLLGKGIGAAGVIGAAGLAAKILGESDIGDIDAVIEVDAPNFPQ